MSSGAASSYASGGGGVSLEHQYAATLLARLLVGAPASELGDRLELAAVRMQGGDVSPVDDLVLEGVAATGTTHRASVGVRRDPKLTNSDSKSVPLIRSYLQKVADHWDEVSTGRWLLTLAVAKPRPAIQQVDALAALARSTPDAAAFAEALARPAATNCRRNGIPALPRQVRTGQRCCRAAAYAGSRTAVTQAYAGRSGSGCSTGSTRIGAFGGGSFRGF